MTRHKELTVESKTARQVLDAYTTEREFQDTVIELFQRCRWLVTHSRPARVKDDNSPTGYSYRTAIQGDKGFPDIIAAKVLSDGNAVLLTPELKSEKGELTTGQKEWLELLNQMRGVFVFVWIPSQFNDIVALLQSNGLPDILTIWKRHVLFAKTHFGLNLAMRERE
jgi:hypothetical protein